jgi:hypothetical protein
MRWPTLNRTQLLPLLVMSSIMFVLTWQLWSKSGVPYTHDGESHIARFANYRVAVREGQIPPRFAPNLMNHYGYPVFNYNYPLANIISVPFSFADVPYQIIWKLEITAAILVGLLGVFIWTRQPIACVAYGSLPILASSILFRGNIGEIWAWAWLPWLSWWLLARPKPTTRHTHLAQGAILSMLFNLSHNVMVVFGWPVLLLYWFLFSEKNQLTKQNLFIKAAGIMLGAVASLWFWLPALAEKSFTVLDQTSISNDYANHFPTLEQLILSPLEFGFSYLGSIDSLSFAVGLVPLLSIILVAGTLFATKKSGSDNEKKWVWWLIVSSCLLFVQLKESELLWGILPLARFIQFPWRLSWLVGWATVPLIAWIYPQLAKKTKMFVLLVALLQLFAIWQLRPADRVVKNDIDYELFAQSTSTMNENRTREFEYLNIGDWQPSPSILEGEGTITVESWMGSRRRYNLTLSEPSLLVEPTMLFPGWQTTIQSNDGTKMKIEYERGGDVAGRLAYRLEPGQYTVSSSFTQWTPSRIIGNSLSLLAFALLGYLLTYNLWQKLLKKTTHS